MTYFIAVQVKRSELTVRVDIYLQGVFHFSSERADLIQEKNLESVISSLVD